MEGILDNVSRLDTQDIKYVTCTEVRDILATMSNNKAGDSYGLCTELAGDIYCSLLAVCFNVMFVHGYVPVEATQTVICPTVNDKNGDLSDFFNYRPLAL